MHWGRGCAVLAREDDNLLALIVPDTVEGAVANFVECLELGEGGGKEEEKSTHTHNCLTYIHIHTRTVSSLATRRTREAALAEARRSRWAQ